MSLPAEIVRIASAEVGVREVGNSNCGPRVNEYKAATWLPSTKPWPWCAAFVCWVIREVIAVMKVPFARPRTAGAFDFENWAAKQPGVLLIRNPQEIKAGDIIVFTFSHIGFAIAPSAGRSRVKTVEGNTNAAGSREGGEVASRMRARSEIRSVIRLGVSVSETPTDFIPLAPWCQKRGIDMSSIKVPSRFYDLETETTYASEAELRALKLVDN